MCLPLALIGLTACSRERTELRPVPARTAIYNNAAVESDIHPGGVQPHTQVNNPYEGNAQAIADGGRLFDWYNCSGCHAHGGGGIGPPLIKKEWIYGGESANLFDTIEKGRPNGMPSWGSRIPEDQVWKLVAYVRSLNQEEPKTAVPPRSDTIEQNTATLQNGATQ
jgi:cytochrome c oxidase cbb3-type subunit 3